MHSMNLRGELQQCPNMQHILENRYFKESRDWQLGQRLSYWH